VKFFIDTADVTEIREASALGLLDGVTTNPSLVARTGRKFEDVLKEIVDELDHFMLLPTAHPLISVEADEQEVTVRFRDRRWIFPRCDCVLLPVPNTTTEMLARHIGRRLLDELQQRTGVRPARVQVAVDENFGQWGVCELHGE